MGFIKVLFLGVLVIVVVHGRSFYQDAEEDNGALDDYIGSDDGGQTYGDDDDVNSDAEDDYANSRIERQTGLKRKGAIRLPPGQGWGKGGGGGGQKGGGGQQGGSGKGQGGGLKRKGAIRRPPGQGKGGGKK